MIKQRIKNPKGGTIGYMVANVLEEPFLSNFVTIGVSLCNELDVFDKNYGEVLAWERQTYYTATTILKNRYSHYGWIKDCTDNESIKIQIESFMSRCIRYYKNRNVVVPKILFT